MVSINYNERFSLSGYPKTEIQSLAYLGCSEVRRYLDYILENMNSDFRDYRVLFDHWTELDCPDLESLRNNLENLEIVQTVRLLKFSSWLWDSGFWRNMEQRNILNLPNAKLSDDDRN